MKVQEIIESLTILEKYRNPENKNKHTIGTDRESIIYAEPTDIVMDEQDIESMIELGWFQEECLDQDGVFKVEHYSVDEPWNAFV